MKYYIGMDVGATRMRIKIADEQGNILSEHESAGGTINVVGYSNVAEVYRDGINAALAKANLAKEDCVCLCAGACGIDSPDLHEQYMQIVSDVGFPREKLKLYNDGEILLHIDEEHNVIAIVAGTGSVMLARRPDGTEARFGGWSQLLGDEGSAFYIVFRAMIHLNQYMDGYRGIGDGKYLLDKFVEASGLTDPYEITRFFHLNCCTTKNEISQYAPVVTEAAKHGDPIALYVMEEAAQSLVVSVDALSDTLGFQKDDDIRVLYWGSILEKVPMISNRLTDLIHERFPNAKATLSQASAVDTALQIAMRG